MKTHTRSIIVFLLAVAIIATYASLAPKVTAAYAEVKSDLSVMTAPTCVGIGRYERVVDPGNREIVVFDTCRGRLYHVTPARQWEILIPAVPDIPPTLAERSEWQRLTTEGLVGQ